MPKSGFDPQRHQRKVHRHNPLSKSNSSSAAPSPSSVSSATLDALQQAVKAANSPSSSKTTAASNDIVPLLANLPASETPSAAPVNLADKVWSLASVSLLLSVSPTQSAAEVKHHRKLLLSHNLIGRLILALQSHTEVDVRREASGALRNLCVDSGIDVRNEVVNKGGVPAILAAMRWASNALGFDASASSSSSNANPAISFLDDAPTQEQDLEAKRALLAKPLDKMNKKEKRHATKLATALGKTLEQVAGQGLSAEDEQKLVFSSSPGNDAMDTTKGAASGRGEPFLALDSNTRRDLIEMAENLVTVVWCLRESGDKAFAKLVAWKWLDQDIVGAGASEELSGEGLASWLSSAIALGSRAAAVLSTAGADGSRASSSLSQDTTETLGALSNEELSLLLDLALASGNALCALTDGGEADFVDGLLSRKPASPLPKSSKKKSSSFKSDFSSSASAPVSQSLDEQPSSATRRLTAIQSALTLLQACVNTDQTGIDKLKRYVLAQTTMLGVLSAGIFRNIAAAVDTKAAASSRGKSSRKHGGANATSVTSANIFVGEGVTLKKFEESVILPTLARLLAGVDMPKLAHDLDGRGDVNEAVSLDSNNKDGLDEAALRMKLQGKAEEKAQTLMLALEVVAEMAASLDSRAGGSGADDEEEEEWLEDPEADEEVDDEDMDMGSDDEDDEDKEEDMDAVLSKKEDDDMGLRSNSNANDTFADAVKRSGTLPFEAYAPILTSLFSASSNDSLTAALLALARPFEASFPSLRSSGPSDKPTSGLLRGLHLRSLSVLNNLLLRLATFSPPPPSQPATDPKLLRRIAAFRNWAQTLPQSATLAEVWGTLFDVAKGCASVPAVATAGAGIVSTANDSDGVIGSAGSLATASNGNGEGLDGLGMVETCIGTMWSLARILEGSVALSSASNSPVTVSDPTASTSEIITALVSGYTSASTDSMRVKCILLLSTIARSPQIHPSLNAFLGNFLVSILESIPEHPSSSTSGTTAESMVAAINGIIDTYADETSPYDATAFRSANLLGRLRLTVFRCKALARQIDRRKQISLRASAEEALDNLTGFIQYRQSLRF
ncbi:uncharacterized protein UTRI_03602 [Ustilago trichophora]|uniref:SYO1-like TPR repeats domain-containing protein n=1 Tax=Ustilago trichophora TaxID=86804 RepID=A0A5C3E0V4_9BASI|nr:uncharacterized protein UTRI_03602 [Ustilago trichophora]